MTDKIKKPKQKLELTWIGKDNRPRLEPRILLPDDEHSHHAAKRSPNGDCFDNKLIYGDNLLVLKSLEQDYSGKVKCVYIDPPYNTGNAFEHYDDGVEHSIWLCLMRDRLELLRTLLCDDGVIVVHIDEVEQAYLKILMDEIFGRNSFVNCIAIQDSHPSGLKLSSKDKKIIKTKSYMLVYKKSDSMRINSIYKVRNDWDTHFNTFLDIDKNPLKQQSLRVVLLEKRIIDSDFKLNKYALQNQNFKKFCFENRNNIFQSTKELPDEARRNSLEQKDVVYEYITNKGERNFALNGRRLSPLVKSIKNTGIDGEQKEDFAKLICDFWDDVDFNNSQNEGGVKFPNSKKPEYLVARILTMFSKKGDLVLDSFAGSGTTGAVAHKMKREWIMVELGDHCYTHIVPRMKQVVDGTDDGGVSKSVDWKGGGGFRAYKLAPSMLKKDKRKQWIINKEVYNPERLAEAMCKHMGFKYAPDGDYWMHGRAHETAYIYVTTQTMEAEQLHALNAEVGNKRSLLVCCSAFMGADDIYKNLTIKKIPDAVLKNCEWGCDSYSLGIQGLPIAEADLKTDLFNEEEKNNG